MERGPAGAPPTASACIAEAWPSALANCCARPLFTAFMALWHEAVLGYSVSRDRRPCGLMGCDAVDAARLTLRHRAGAEDGDGGPGRRPDRPVWGGRLDCGVGRDRGDPAAPWPLWYVPPPPHPSSAYTWACIRACLGLSRGDSGADVQRSRWIWLCPRGSARSRSPQPSRTSTTSQPRCCARQRRTGACLASEQLHFSRRGPPSPPAHWWLGERSLHSTAAHAPAVHRGHNTGSFTVCHALLCRCMPGVWGME